MSIHLNTGIGQMDVIMLCIWTHDKNITCHKKRQSPYTG